MFRRGEQTMKEKPILFSTPMVQALLNTKPNTWPAAPIDPEKPFKSMTRRVITPQPETLATSEQLIIEYGKLKRIWRGEMALWQSKTEGKPKYNIGDILWVRETWLKVIWVYDKSGNESHKYFYRADGEIKDNSNLDAEIDKWTSPIFMPREAARLFFEVKSVRVERLQDISDADVKAEGWPKSSGYRDQPIEFVGAYCEARASTAKRDKEVCPIDFCHDQSCYAAFWNILNAKHGYSWESNPFVWVYEFMRVEK
jgi:hypothetical protein